MAQDTTGLPTRQPGLGVPEVRSVDGCCRNLGIERYQEKDGPSISGAKGPTDCLLIARGRIWVLSPVSRTKEVWERSKQWSQLHEP